MLTSQFSGEVDQWDGKDDFELIKIVKPLFNIVMTDQKAGEYLSLPSLTGSYNQNRFVGDYLLYSSVQELEGEKYTSSFVSYSLGDDSVNELDIEFGIARIEPVGSNALLMGGYDEHMLG